MLATSISEKTGARPPIVWTMTYGKARVFKTTFGHLTEMFSDDVFLRTLLRGLQWAAGREVESAPAE